MSLERNWQRLYDWCVRQAPVTAAAMSSPAEVSLLDTVESATGRRWPTELRAWFGLHNGASEGKPFAQVLPSFEPLSLERGLSVWASMTTTWADMTDELGGTALLDEPAGTMSFTYLTAYIPIAENDQGDLLVVDTRAGEQHGCAGLRRRRCRSEHDGVVLDRSACRRCRLGGGAQRAVLRVAAGGRERGIGLGASLTTVEG
ncbi:hypothetical protein NJ76_27955 [Rhodococcus sp. IITR03]|nr:hypothetical protein NJ76_27955 [Rhodococcus sp. IITR03]